MSMGSLAYRLLGVVLVAAIPSCSNEITNVDRPPVVRFFYPEDQTLSAFVGDTLTFQISAMDPDRQSIKQQFSLDDSVVSRQPSWHYVVADTGRALVRCVVSDGVHDSRIEWELARHQAIDSPPVLTAYSPVEVNPTVIIGQTIEFAVQAYDPEGDTLRYTYDIDGVTVSKQSRFVYFAEEISAEQVTATVSDGEHGVNHVWNLTITPVPDTIPPAQIQIIAVETGERPGEINVAWIAVGADSMDGIASNYLVRTSPWPFLDEIDWSRGSERPNVPLPAQPGEAMRMVVGGLMPARFTYLTVRAVDDFGNLSPLGESPGGYTRGMRITGSVLDALTQEPLPNVTVDVGHFHGTTGFGGEFEFVEMPPINDYITVSDDGIAGTIGNYFDYRRPYTVVHNDYLLIHLIPNYQLQTTRYIDFLQFYLAMTEIVGLPFPNHQRRWKPPIDIYAQPFVNEGLDFQLTIHQVAVAVGLEIGLADAFNVSDHTPEIGVNCVYRSDILYDNFGVDEWSKDYYPVKGTIEFRTRYTIPTKPAFERVIRHELGHALGLNHSTDDMHLMIGGESPQVDTFHPDEIAVLRVFYNIPRGVAISSYYRE